jgi:hypothetical protein
MVPSTSYSSLISPWPRATMPDAQRSHTFGGVELNPLLAAAREQVRDISNRFASTSIRCPED